MTEGVLKGFLNVVVQLLDQLKITRPNSQIVSSEKSWIDDSWQNETSLIVA